MTKKLNQYAELFSEDFYKKTPKAVFAALAASFFINFEAGGQVEGCLDSVAVKEWGLLYHQGIVPQSPPKPKTKEGE